MFVTRLRRAFNISILFILTKRVSKNGRSGLDDGEFPEADAEHFQL